MALPIDLHCRNFREKEKAWNDKAALPIAVFIGLSPPKAKYFRCFVKHSDRADCSMLSTSPRSFANSILEVVSGAGFEITGHSKEEKIESLSQNFCVVDFFESTAAMRKSLRLFRKGRYDDSVVEPSVTAVRQIALRCREHGQRLRVIAALGGCVDPARNTKEGRGRWGFRWSLWNSMTERLEKELNELVIFVRQDGAHLFSGSDAWGKWRALVLNALNESVAERAERSSGRVGMGYPCP